MSLLHSGILRALLLLCPLAVAAALPPRLLRGPYLQMATPDSMVVRWRTDRLSPGQVLYGPRPDALTNRVSHPGDQTEHVVQITGLRPDTRYCYTVAYATNRWFRRPNDALHFITPPAVGTEHPFRFWVIGDAGTATSSQSRVRNAFYSWHRQRPCDLWLMLGDNAYPNGTDAEYQRAVFDMYGTLLQQRPVWPTLGNHDGHSADSATLSGPYYDMFTLPTLGQSGGVPSGTEAYYAFDHGNVHFVCLDSHDSDRSPDGAMGRWLRADLAETRARWIIAYFHHPPYTKGSHDSDKKSDSGARLVEMREKMLPLLEGGGVDLVLTGHSHSYERSFLLDGHYGYSKDLKPEMILDKGSGRPDLEGAYRKPDGAAPHRGAVYIVAGSSGQISGGSLNHPAMWLSLNKLGSVVIDVDGPAMDVRFLGDDGQVRDYFTLRKD